MSAQRGPWLWAFLVAALVAGCNTQRLGTDDTGGDGGTMMVNGGLIVSPPKATVTATDQPVSVKYTAKTRDGNDVTDTAAWTLSDPRLGQVSHGTVTVPGMLGLGGTAQVIASQDQASGAATLEIKYQAPDIFVGGAGPDAPGAFGGPAGGAAPAFVYPFSGVMLAKNINQMRLAWQAAAGNKLYRVAITSATLTQNIYLGAAACTGNQCQYLVDDKVWDTVARSVAGGQAKLTLSGTAGAGQPVGTADPMVLNFSPENVRGGLYYFSTSQWGLFRLPFGGTMAAPFVLGKRDNSVDRCIGCHTISRDGKKVAAEWAGGDGYGGIVDGADATKYLYKPIAGAQGQVWNFASYNPDGTRLIAVWNGKFSLRDGSTGKLLQNIDPNLIGGRGSMPEWSPDGKFVVFVRIPPGGGLGVDFAVRNAGQPAIPVGDWILGDSGDIAMLPYMGNDTFGAAVTLVPSAANAEFHFYPSVSPDSQWIVFNSARKANCVSATAGNNGINLGLNKCITYDQQAARLRLVRAQMGQTPIELTAATHALNRTTAWPKFAPFQQNGGKLVFFTFSSKFDYGWVVQEAAIKALTGYERPQLWMSAIDLGKAAAGTGDPSYPPFWLPFQNPADNNHEVLWTNDIACVSASDCGSPNEFDCVGGVCVPKLG